MEPGARRIVGDMQPEREWFIPTDGSRRSADVLERCARMTPEEIAELGARWLAEHHPHDPYLHAHLAQRDI